MKIGRSSSRMRMAAMLVILAGGAAFFAARQMDGTAAYVFAAISLALFVLEIIYGVLDGPRHGDPQP